MLGEWAHEQGHTLTATRLYLGEPLPDVTALDWLVVMGGPMSSYDEDKYTWLAPEKRCIEQAIRHGKTVIGICLGAQLLANVLGARVYPHTHKEIGWFPIELTEAGQQSPLFGFLPRQFAVFHWHGDTFDMPQGASHLAFSQACPHQLFVYEQRVVGLQFHMEMTQAGIEAIMEHCADELVAAPTIQQPDTIRERTTTTLAQAHGMLRGVLQRLAA
jgi:GMP synthase (glutamine-hydrolysing)